MTPVDLLESLFAEVERCRSEMSRCVCGGIMIPDASPLQVASPARGLCIYTMAVSHFCGCCSLSLCETFSRTFVATDEPVIVEGEKP